MNTARGGSATDPENTDTRKGCATAAERQAPGWIATGERMPGKEDVDPAGCVLAWHEDNGCMVVYHAFVKSNRLYTHWQRLPDGPKDGGNDGKQSAAPHDDAADHGKK